VGFLSGKACGIRALAIAALVGAGCGSSRSLPAAGDQGGKGGAGGEAGAAGVGGAAGGGGADAGVSDWPVTLRLVNTGTTKVDLPELFAMVCGFSISVAPAAGGDAHLTSATAVDTWCDCADCVPGRRFCGTTDFLCDGPMFSLAPGDHLDVGWDGQIAVTGGAPPVGSTCPSTCDHWETVGAGDYIFTMQTLSGELMAQASLPAAAGIVLLAIDGAR
jgi:hypothetical protein